MGSITTLWILKHDRAGDNLSDLVLKVTGHSFKDMKDTIDRFITEYNTNQSQNANPPIYDSYIADRRDMAEMDSQVYSYEATLHTDDDDEDEGGKFNPRAR